MLLTSRISIPKQFRILKKNLADLLAGQRSYERTIEQSRFSKLEEISARELMTGVA